VVAVLVASTAWIAVRALMAKSDLEASVSLVSTIKTEVAKGDVSAARASSAELAKKAESARSLTSDPVWRAAEAIPWVGGNLTAVRQVSDVVATVADDSITPLAAVAGSINLSAFRPVNGAIQLEPLIKAQPTLAAADAVMQAQLTRAEAIDTSGTLGFVSKAVTQLTTSLRSAGQITDAVSRASTLLPSMLGHNGPRNYLLLFQNNAELRSTGGIPGALALVHVENGAISLTQQASTGDFPKYSSPVLPLSAETTALYQSNVGEYIQDVTATPQFPVAAQLAREMWKRQYGTEVDGVLTIDPVALSYLLKATGPVTLATGDRLTSGNAVKLLLSETYARYPDPKMQDAFFASAAAEVFAKVAGGSFNPTTMIKALAKAGGERRILIWSANAGEQKSLAQTTLAGDLPKSSSSEQQFGVYLNDNTAAKMDYYLHTSIALGQATCRADKRPTYAVSVTLASDAPADAATSLPSYVTGGGGSGVPAGVTQTIVSVYAPRGATLIGATSDGKQFPVNWATLGGHPVGAATVALPPGQKITVQFQFVGKAPHTGGLAVQSTPGVHPAKINGLDFRCGSALR